jgi:hypothetical protein
MFFSNKNPDKHINVMECKIILGCDFQKYSGKGWALYEPSGIPEDFQGPKDKMACVFALGWRCLK